MMLRKEERQSFYTRKKDINLLLILHCCGQVLGLISIEVILLSVVISIS